MCLAVTAPPPTACAQVRTSMCVCVMLPFVHLTLAHKLAKGAGFHTTTYEPSGRSHKHTHTHTQTQILDGNVGQQTLRNTRCKRVCTRRSSRPACTTRHAHVQDAHAIWPNSLTATEKARRGQGAALHNKTQDRAAVSDDFTTLDKNMHSEMGTYIGHAGQRTRWG